MVRIATPDDDGAQVRRWAIPAWLLSLACHLAAMLLGAWLIGRPAPPRGIIEADRPAGIVLVQRSVNLANYFSDAESAAAVGDRQHVQRRH